MLYLDKMYLELLLIALGFILLVKGADYLIKGASNIAQRFGISYFIIGLTIIAFGTSLPEFIVNVLSALKGTTDIAVGNILGSNMANLLLIIGISSIIMPIEINIYAKKTDIPYALFSSILLLVLACDMILWGSVENHISRIDGVILLTGFIAFIYFVLRRTIDETSEEDYYDMDFGTLRTIVYISAGVVGLYLGGELIVENAISLARALSISDILISSTIVAFGTSLPELATSLIAAYNHKCDIAVGNIIGSNIFNILWVLGISSIITTMPIRSTLLIDMGLVILASVVLLALTYIGLENIISWKKGIFMLIFYIAYIAMLVIRG